MIVIQNHQHVQIASKFNQNSSLRPQNPSRTSPDQKLHLGGKSIREDWRSWQKRNDVGPLRAVGGTEGARRNKTNLVHASSSVSMETWPLVGDKELGFPRTMHIRTEGRSSGHWRIYLSPCMAESRNMSSKTIPQRTYDLYIGFFGTRSKCSLGGWPLCYQKYRYMQYFH